MPINTDPPPPCKIGHCGLHCNCFNNIDCGSSGCQWCQIIGENRKLSESLAEAERRLSQLNKDKEALIEQRDAAYERQDNTRRELESATEDIERARTYQGIEGWGCPLCTYVEGKFVALCSLHRKLEDTKLQVESLLKAMKEIAAIPPTGDGGLMKAQNIADEAYALKQHHENCDVNDLIIKTKPCNCEGR